MEILAKGSPVALGDALAIERLKFTAARLAEAASRKPEFDRTREYASGLADSLWPRLGYVCEPAQSTEIERIFGKAIATAVTGEANETAAPTQKAPAATGSGTEQFRFDTCTVTLTVTLLPANETGERRAVVGVRTHELAPSITCRLVGRDSLATDLAAAVGEALERCRTDLPLRAADELRKTSKTKKSTKRAKGEKPADALFAENGRPENV